MSPAIAAAFQRVSHACSQVLANKAEHLQLEADLQLLAKKLTPRPRREKPTAPAPRGR